MNMDFIFAHADVLGRLRASIKEGGSQAAFAHAHGFSRAYLSDVVRVVRQISDRLAQALGFRRVVAFGAAENFVEG